MNTIATDTIATATINHHTHHPNHPILHLHQQQLQHHLNNHHQQQQSQLAKQGNYLKHKKFLLTAKKLTNFSI